MKFLIKKEVQPDGRIGFWEKVEQLGGKYLRVVLCQCVVNDLVLGFRHLLSPVFPIVPNRATGVRT